MLKFCVQLHQYLLLHASCFGMSFLFNIAENDQIIERLSVVGLRGTKHELEMNLNLYRPIIIIDEPKPI